MEADKIAGTIPDIIVAAAQSLLGFLALLVILLSFLAFSFFASASEKVRVGIFVLLFCAAVVVFGFAMFRVISDAPVSPTPVGPTPTPDPPDLKPPDYPQPNPVVRDPSSPRHQPPSSPPDNAVRGLAPDTKTLIYRSDRCKDYKEPLASCQDAVSGASATISIVPCDMINVSKIRISPAGGDDYEIDKNSTNFEVPPGNKDTLSNVDIFYRSLYDDIERVKPIYVNNFGQCKSQ